MMHPKSGYAFRLTGDQALGLAGVCLAAASATFGIGMMLHGPDASFAKAKDFTVFAQLATRHADPGPSRPEAPSDADVGELDMTSTASIRRIEPRDADARESAILPNVTLEAVGTDSATVAIEGRTRVVRVGDEVPGAGQVMAILPGARPVIRTSRGLIAPAE